MSSQHASAPGTLNGLTVVIIDDDPDHRDLIRLQLGAAPLGVEQLSIATFSDPAEAIVAMPADGDVVILCDHCMPSGDGLDWLPDLLRVGVGPVILLTGAGDELIASEAFKRGASDYLVKSQILAGPESLHRSIRESIRRWKLEVYSRELARSLRITNAELEHKNALLNELTETAHRFVDDVAHEFRTPLAVIGEFAAIIDDGIGGEVSDTQHEYLGHIRDATRDLARLVDDFLDSSRLRAGSLRVDRRAWAPRQIIDHAWSLLESRGQSRGIALHRDVPLDLPEVHADLEKSARILVNLVVNAIKFSGSGTDVTVRATAVAEAVRIDVIDRGRGMPQAEIERLFDRFERSARMDARVDGVGLGLSIAAELSRLNLGDLSVTSEEGVGSIFSFTLPEATPHATVQARVAQWARRDEGRTTVFVAALRTTFLDHLLTSEGAVRPELSAILRPMDVILRDTDRLLILGEAERPHDRLTDMAEAIEAQAAIVLRGDGDSGVGRAIADATLDLVATYAAETDPAAVAPAVLQLLPNTIGEGTARCA